MDSSLDDGFRYRCRREQVAALVPKNGRLLVVENGVYGERIALICAQYGIDHARIVGDWLQAPDLHAVAVRLKSQPKGAGLRMSPWFITKPRPAGSTIFTNCRSCAATMGPDCWSTP